MRLQVDECCCGCSLRTGAMIIAVLSLMNSAFLAVTPFSWDMAPSRMRSIEGSVPVFKIAAWTTAGVLTFVSILMLIGTLKMVRGLLMPWLVLMVLYIVLWLGCGIVGAVLLFLEGAFLLGSAVFLVALNMTSGD
ncbi:uncharacterized protein [Anabrus simplex]|uniref:uncharacterized protein isoform X2 n=1 Tax=Anabrus simplex TaxID=316456 RepID=UPI0034DD037B